MEPESGPQHGLGHARPGSVRPAAAEQLRDGEVERPDELEEGANHTFSQMSQLRYTECGNAGVLPFDIS